MQLVNIKATTLPDAWYQCLYNCVDKGRKFKIDSGSYAGQERLEFDYITIQIKYSCMRPLLPQIPEQYNIPNPVTEEYLNDYVSYLMTAEKKENESYTYGSRLCNSTFIDENNVYSFLDQIQYVIDSYKTKGHRNNQNVMQIGLPEDLLLDDPACLRHIDTRIQDNKLHFFVYFRSWDLFGGMPANLAAIQILKEYMGQEIGVEDGEIIASSKGLHLYDHYWHIAEILRGRNNLTRGW